MSLNHPVFHMNILYNAGLHILPITDIKIHICITKPVTNISVVSHAMKRPTTNKQHLKQHLWEIFVIMLLLLQGALFET